MVPIYFSATDSVTLNGPYLNKYRNKAALQFGQTAVSKSLTSRGETGQTFCLVVLPEVSPYTNYDLTPLETMEESEMTYQAIFTNATLKQQKQRREKRRPENRKLQKKKKVCLRSKKLGQNCSFEEVDSAEVDILYPL